MEDLFSGFGPHERIWIVIPAGDPAQALSETSSATSKSAVSRKFVAMTETGLAELLSRGLSGLNLVAPTIDGVHFAESCCVATLVPDLRERGLDVTRPMLVGFDGSKALREAVVDVLDRPVIQRCQNP